NEPRRGPNEVRVTCSERSEKRRPGDSHPPASRCTPQATRNARTGIGRSARHRAARRDRHDPTETGRLAEPPADMGTRGGRRRCVQGPLAHQGWDVTVSNPKALNSSAPPSSDRTTTSCDSKRFPLAESSTRLIQRLKTA